MDRTSRPCEWSEPIRCLPIACAQFVFRLINRIRKTATTAATRTDPSPFRLETRSTLTPPTPTPPSQKWKKIFKTSLRSPASQPHLPDRGKPSLFNLPLYGATAVTIDSGRRVTNRPSGLTHPSLPDCELTRAQPPEKLFARRNCGSIFQIPWQST